MPTWISRPLASTPNPWSVWAAVPPLEKFGWPGRIRTYHIQFNRLSRPPSSSLANISNVFITIILWRPWEDSNPHSRFRRPMLYPVELQGQHKMTWMLLKGSNLCSVDQNHVSYQLDEGANLEDSADGILPSVSWRSGGRVGHNQRILIRVTKSYSSHYEHICNVHSKVCQAKN